MQTYTDPLTYAHAHIYRRSHVVSGNANVYTFMYSYLRIYVDHLMTLDVYENSYRPHLYIYMYMYIYIYMCTYIYIYIYIYT